MLDSLSLTARQWGRFYSDGIRGFFRTMGPDEYMIMTVIAFLLAVGLMRMNFGR